jgi:hypothetical protein
MMMMTGNELDGIFIIFRGLKINVIRTTKQTNVITHSLIIAGWLPTFSIHDISMGDFVTLFE